MLCLAMTTLLKLGQNNSPFRKTQAPSFSLIITCYRLSDNFIVSSSFPSSQKKAPYFIPTGEANMQASGSRAFFPDITLPRA
jgi:hypothetical protein